MVVQYMQNKFHIILQFRHFLYMAEILRNFDLLIRQFYYYSSLHGHFETQAIIRPNYAVGTEYGFVKTILKNGTTYINNVPRGKITGITFGDRTLVWVDSCWMLDEKNKLLA